jgi:hypothetical protein
MNTAIAPSSSNSNESLAEIVAELNSNQAILDDLTKHYRIFRFTGGDVPQRPWRLVAVTSYLEQPFLVERIGSSRVERYRELAKSIMALGLTVTKGVPRTLRHRSAIAATFVGIAAEIRAAGILLEGLLSNLLREHELATPVPVMVPAQPAGNGQ